MKNPIKISTCPYKNKLPRKYPKSGVHIKLIKILIIVNFLFEKLLLISSRGISKNSANNINARKTVISKGLILFNKEISLNSNPSIIAPKIKIGSNFSIIFILLTSNYYKSYY